MTSTSHFHFQALHIFPALPSAHFNGRLMEMRWIKEMDYIYFSEPYWNIIPLFTRGAAITDFLPLRDTAWVHPEFLSSVAQSLSFRLCWDKYRFLGLERDKVSGSELPHAYKILQILVFALFELNIWRSLRRSYNSEAVPFYLSFDGLVSAATGRIKWI